MSEMMLRRTRADQVVPVYNEAIERYPNASALASASPEELDEVLYPLGLSWRISNISTMAREVVALYGGRVPSEPARLSTLTGVGDYVANAVSCFAKGRCEAIVDTNVVRVLGRVFGLSTHGEARRRKEMREAAEACVDPSDPVAYNYALLDFAALVCSARSPSCDDCPIAQAELCEFAKQQE